MYASNASSEPVISLQPFSRTTTSPNIYRIELPSTTEWTKSMYLQSKPPLSPATSRPSSTSTTVSVLSYNGMMTWQAPSRFLRFSMTSFGSVILSRESLLLILLTLSFWTVKSGKAQRYMIERPSLVKVRHRQQQKYKIAKLNDFKKAER